MVEVVALAKKFTLGYSSKKKRIPLSSVEILCPDAILMLSHRKQKLFHFVSVGMQSRVWD
jgi:hypothetical protein